jgi:catechol 2,3-dioxygenase
LVLAAGKAPDQKSTVNQISFRFQKFSDLREMKGKLDKRGIAYRPVDHGCAWSFYIDDPEGNGIEIYVDSPWMITQPYGKPMDWSKTDEELLKATEAMVRAEPSFSPRADWEKKNAKQFA